MRGAGARARMNRIAYLFQSKVPCLGGRIGSRGHSLVSTDKTARLLVKPPLGEQALTRLDVVEIELGDIESIEQLHERLMDKLRSPAWYGKNWDAFWDAITALVDMPHVLRLKHWAEFERKFPSEAKVMADCLHDMEKQFPSYATRIDRI